MAIEHLAPEHHRTVPADLESLEDLAALLAETGHPASVREIRRWIESRELYTERRGPKRKIYASNTEILEAHRDWVHSRARRGVF
ncbi:hypothetical protein [Streptomyces lavendofoliae]|uniref:Uncharacterized protein n=1 Tax=Streptomyces lavendofoliae TaxID=67314 RepID=A0A918I354_9ACTN|nr:hypothetical protein [Streptomyces lavendofoliae]GGU62056.1 hypothetical protein GCM10010274_58530 [Streptomyces lavendofoliae]